MIIPLNDNILLDITPKAAEKETSFGLLLVSEGTKQEPNRGLIQAVGDKVEGLKEGNEIIYNKWGGTQFSIDDKLLLLIKASSVLALIK